MPFPWVFFLVFLAAALSGSVVYFLMQARLKEALKSTEESTKRKALDEFLADMRVEERHYVREHKLLFMRRKSVVMQERMYFRNIPLSNWIEQERLLEEGADIDDMARSLSIFDPNVLLPGAKPQTKKLKLLS